MDVDANIAKPVSSTIPLVKNVPAIETAQPTRFARLPLPNVNAKTMSKVSNVPTVEKAPSTYNQAIQSDVPPAFVLVKPPVVYQQNSI